MQVYTTFDFEAHFNKKDLDGFMSQETVSKITNKVLKRMQGELDLMLDVSLRREEAIPALRLTLTFLLHRTKTTKTCRKKHSSRPRSPLASTILTRG
jgi:hypothetical protein